MRISDCNNIDDIKNFLKKTSFPYYVYKSTMGQTDDFHIEYSEKRECFIGAIGPHKLNDLCTTKKEALESVRCYKKEHKQDKEDV